MHKTGILCCHKVQLAAIYEVQIKIMILLTYNHVFKRFEIIGK